MSLCPFCSLHCDDLAPERGDYKNCGLAKEGFTLAASPVARVGKAAVTREQAVAAAVERLAAAQSVRVDAEAADIATQKQALYLARKLGQFAVGQRFSDGFASCGSRTTSLGECALRADLVIILGEPPRAMPRAVEKLFAAATAFAKRRRTIKLTGANLLRQLANLHIAAKADDTSHPLLRAVKAADYTVLALASPRGEPLQLILGAIAELLETLNRSSRVTLLPLEPEPGRPGAGMLSGAIPAEASGYAFAATLWVDLFGLRRIPPSSAKPLVLLGRVDNRRADIFIPAATPGIDGGGKMMRGDSVSIAVLEPYKKAAEASAAEILEEILEGVGG